jgi:NADPH:quinone reductase-like Zn-dependent oxidoreductase
MVAPCGQAVGMPEGIGLEQAAALGIPFMIAHRCLFADGPINDRCVLVAGGAGAVGHAAIQLAKRGGASVIAAVSTPGRPRSLSRPARRSGRELPTAPRSR